MTRTNTPREIAVGVLVLFAALCSPATADVTLPSIIGDNMVLQRDMPLPVWGSADPGEKVTVKLCGKTASATADDKGKWRVKLGEMSAGGPFDMTVAGKNTITVKNILVGEVWVCSGQSNMAMSVAGSSTAKEAIAGANFPKYRLLKAAMVPAPEPADDVEGQWVEATSKSVPGFSAAGYFFGRELHKALGVPVGMVQSAWGGTPARAWTSLEAIEANPELKDLALGYHRAFERHPDLKEKWQEYWQTSAKASNAYRKERAKWLAEVKKAKAEGRKAPPRPKYPKGIAISRGMTSVLYNGMIAPLVPYAIRGAIWYQGEADAGRAYQYRTLFPAMITCWRKAWGQGDFPFIFVQLPNFRQPVTEPGESNWAELREAQSMTLSLPNAGMAITIDIGEADNIHPKNKEDVGKRLAQNALGTVYGKKVAASGPLYESMSVKGGKVCIKFRHTDGGLVAKGGPLKYFSIAGEDKKFVWADAEIDGDTVVVSSGQVAEPVAVRYAWADNPDGCNLYNKAGLPASPFRTDDWPGITAPKK